MAQSPITVTLTTGIAFIAYIPQPHKDWRYDPNSEVFYWGDGDYNLIFEVNKFLRNVITDALGDNVTAIPKNWVIC